MELEILQKFRIKTYVDGNGISEEISQMFRLEKIRNSVIREKMNIKNYVLDDRRYRQLNWYGRMQRMHDERLAQKIWNGVQPEEEKEDLEIHRCRK
jgi:hypothetical protein